MNSILNNRLLLLILSLFLAELASGTMSSNFQPVELRCEYLKEPLALDKQHPRFSWIINCRERNVLQSAWQIKVGKTEKGLCSRTDLVWDSGWRISSQSVNVNYEGELLQGCTSYYWQVRIKDDNGNLSKWSKPEHFHTGFMNEETFQAVWIANEDSAVRSPLFRKQFSVSKNISEAYLYITAIGLYEAYLNGQKINPTAFDPPMTQYTERVLYSTWQVTKLVKEGDNILGFWLGEGMAAFTTPEANRFASGKKPPGPFGRPMMLAQLEIHFEDGTKEIITTDNNWKSTQSPVIFNNYYGGEDCDAREKLPGWNQAGFDDSNWQPVIPGHYAGKIQASLLPPVREFQYLKPVASIKRDERTWEFDLGTTITGYWYIEMKGEKGTTVQIRGSEASGSGNEQNLLSKENKIYWGKYHGFNHGYYSRDVWSTYILKGDEVETYKPHFFYTGYRYLQIMVDDPEDFKLIKVRGVQIHDDIERRGFFHCSNELLNTIHDNTLNTFNEILFQGVPLSNPHSEKYGWTGDITLTSEVADDMFFMPAFWGKWLEDFGDAQHWSGNGIIPQVVPELRDEKSKATAAWGRVYPSLLWEMYKFYGDRELLRNHIGNLMAWYRYLLNTSDNWIIGGIWADHQAPGVLDGKYISRGTTPEIARLVNTACLYQITVLIQKIQEVLGNWKEAASLSQDAMRIRSIFNENFYDRDAGHYAEGPSPNGYVNGQTANLVPIQMGLVPDSLLYRVQHYVIQDIKNRGNKFYTGILGTKALIDVLMENNQEDFLYELVNQWDFPGWGFTIERGATSLWQSWNGEDDFIHNMFGSVNTFFYSGILGIRCDSLYAHKITIEPYFPKDMRFAEGQIQSIYGLIKSEWEKQKNKLQIRVTIPGNTTGQLVINDHGKQFKEVKESGYPVVQINSKRNTISGIIGFEKRDNGIIISLGSGSYDFSFVYY